MQRAPLWLPQRTCRMQNADHRPADQQTRLKNLETLHCVRKRTVADIYIYIYIYNWGAGSRALVPPVSEIPGPGVWEESGRVLEAELLMEALGPQNY